MQKNYILGSLQQQNRLTRLKRCCFCIFLCFANKYASEISELSRVNQLITNFQFSLFQKYIKFLMENFCTCTQLRDTLAYFTQFLARGFNKQIQITNFQNFFKHVSQKIIIKCMINYTKKNK